MVPTLVHILKKSFFDFYRGMFLRAILRLQPNLLRHPLPVMGAMLSYAAKDGQVVQVHTGNWAELVEMRSLEDVALTVQSEKAITGKTQAMMGVM